MQLRSVEHRSSIMTAEDIYFFNSEINNHNIAYIKSVLYQHFQWSGWFTQSEKLIT